MLAKVEKKLRKVVILFHHFEGAGTIAVDMQAMVLMMMMDVTMTHPPPPPPLL